LKGAARTRGAFLFRARPGALVAQGSATVAGFISIRDVAG